MTRVSPVVADRMLAVTIDAFRSPPAVREVSVPHPGPGQVLVRMAEAPINPSDVAFLKGGYGSPKGFPLIPGFEGSGTVIAAGPGLMPRFLSGKRVACATDAAHGGTWAEYLVTSAASCIPLPGGVSLEQGASAIVNPMTALAFFDMAKRDGHAAIVNTAAAGALGRMILRLGLRTQTPVIHIVRRKDQADMLASLGAQHVLDSSDPDFLQHFRSLSHQIRATLILDAVGGELTRVLIEGSPFGSSLVVYGFLSGEPPAIDTRLLAKEDKRVIGFFLPNWLKKKHPLALLNEIRRMRKLLASDLTTIIRKRFALSEIDLALQAASNSTTSGKIQLSIAA